MDRRLYILNSPDTRKTVAAVVGGLTRGFRVEIKAPARTLPQNDRFWASLTAVADQHAHNGVTLSPEDWKLVFLDAYWRFKGEELRLVPNLDGNGFVPLSGRSSSDLTKDEMSELLEMIYAKGAEWGVIFYDERSQGAGGVSSPARVAA